MNDIIPPNANRGSQSPRPQSFDEALYARRVVRLNPADYRANTPKAKVPSGVISDFRPARPVQKPVVESVVSSVKPAVPKTAAPAHVPRRSAGSMDGVFIATPVKPVAKAAPVQPAPRPVEVVLPKAVLTPVAEVAVEAPVAPSEEARQDEKLAEKAPRVKKRADRKVSRAKKRARAWYGAAIASSAVVLALTGYVSIDTWFTNNEVKQVVRDEQSSTLGATSTLAGEGEDESDVTTDTIDSYAVAGDLPRVLSIPSIDVKARILPMSVNSDGSVQAPINIFDSGWYTGSAKPGNPGATFIDAHASGMTRLGLFAYLDTMKQGDTIEIQRGDGVTLTYAVVAVDIQDKDKIDMSDVLKPYGNATEGLNLMACTGTWLPKEKTYDQRTIVYAERVE